jgi:flagellum-specific peptidoglycan hydrolase FlgJ
MNAQQNAFLKIVIPAAQAAQSEYGIPAAVTIAQAILESSNKKGWGQSSLALQANNFFGIKDSDHESYMEFVTKEDNGGAHLETARFEKYASIADCFIAHARLLAGSKRYRPAMAVKTDPAKFAAAVQRCGYSSNPNYAQSLMRLMAQYDLTQYDTQQNIQPAAPAEG